MAPKRKSTDDPVEAGEAKKCRITRSSTKASKPDAPAVSLKATAVKPLAQLSTISPKPKAPRKTKTTTKRKAASKAKRGPKAKAAANNTQAAPEAQATTEANTEPARARPEGCDALTTQATEPAPAAAAAPEAPPFLPALFAGKFDLYDADHQDAGLPAPFEHAAVCRALRASQGWGRVDGQIVVCTGAAVGRFAFAGVCNPVSREHEPLEPVHVVDGRARDVAFGGEEAVYAQAAGRGPAYAARLEMDSEMRCGYGFPIVESARGYVKMRKVWEGKVVEEEERADDGEEEKENQECDGGNKEQRGEDEQDVELFAGYFMLEVTYGELMRKRVANQTFRKRFWALRADKDENGVEIGIEDGDGTYVSFARRALGDQYDEAAEDF